MHEMSQQSIEMVSCCELLCFLIMPLVTLGCDFILDYLDILQLHPAGWRLGGVRASSYCWKSYRSDCSDLDIQWHNPCGIAVCGSTDRQMHKTVQSC